LREKFNPRNINHRPAVKFFARLDLDQICLFWMDTSYHGANSLTAKLPDWHRDLVLG